MFGVEYHLVDYCNLNCAGCAHYSPLDRDKRIVPLEIIERDFSLLASVTESGEKLDYLRLMGGEPLLHPQISEVCQLSRSLFKRCDISIVTNALLLKQMHNSFFEACSRNKVTIDITDYHIIDLGNCIRRMESLGVNVKIYRDGNKWYYKFLTMSGGAECYKHCRQRIVCNNYREGKLYLCAQMAYIHIFNNFFNQNIQISPSEYIELKHVKSFKELVCLRNELHPSFCDFYCNNTTSKGCSVYPGVRRTTSYKIEEFCQIE